MRPAQTRIRDWARRLAPLIVALVIACLVYQRNVRNQPERLLNLNSGNLRGPGKIIDGQMFWMTDDSDGSVIEAIAVTGGTERRIVHENPQWQILYTPSGGFTLTPSSVYYGLIPRPKISGIGAGGGMGGPPIRYLGTFRMTARKPTPEQAAHEKRVVVKTSSRMPPPMRIRRVSLHGGTPQDVAHITEQQPVIVGDNLFWIAPRPDDAVQITNGREVRIECAGHSDLMLTPLNGGPARKLASGLSAETALSPGADGIFWVEPHPFPDTSVDLYHYRVTDAKLQVIKGFEGDFYPWIPVEYQGRLYWFSARRDVDANLKERTSYSLISANADGSDVQMLPSPLDGRRTPESPLVLHRGSLYFVYIDNSRAQGTRYLYRFPGPAGKGEIVRKLPNRSSDPQFVGDYLYFVLTESKRSLIAQLTDDPVAPPSTRTLCRLRLPD